MKKLALLWVVGSLSISWSCGQDEGVANTNRLRLESGDFDPNKPTIVFFGGGNCVNSWEGTESWANEETDGSAWFAMANVISYHSYRRDRIAGDTTYFDAAKLFVDQLGSLSPEYSGSIQACGFSTGGTPALDLALYINTMSNNLEYQVNNVTLMDSPCYDYTDRLAQLHQSESPPLIVNLMGVLYNENRLPIADVVNVDVIDAHDDVFWWYVNTLTIENANSHNEGITGGAYLSVVGEGNDFRVKRSNAIEYYFNWIGDTRSGNFEMMDMAKYPGRIPKMD